jgi:radical SAM superfamily enzyme YgiQ (UPF0313 family)
MNSEVALIVTHTVTSGVRQLSSVLKSKGITPCCLFLYYDGLYSEDILEQIYEKVKDTKFVGISLIESGLNKPLQIVDYIRKRGYSNTIVLGGVFAMLSPRECIEYADVVCAFEAENIIYDLVFSIVNGGDLNNIPGILYRKEGKIFETEGPTKYVDINSLPMPDYVDCDNHYYIINNQLAKMDSSERVILKDEGCIDLYGSRGCIFNCSYCCVPEWTRRCGGYRKKDIELFLREIEYVVSFFKNIKIDELYICIMDEDFLSRSLSEIAYFSKEYKRRIGVPFMCLSSPISITKEKTQLLMDANADYFYLGIQSGSEDVMKNIYNRPGSSLEQILEHCKVLFNTIKENNKQRDFKVTMDFFYNNKLERRSDRKETIRAIIKIFEDSEIDYLAYTMELAFFSGNKISEDAIKLGYEKIVNRSRMMNRGQVMYSVGKDRYKREIDFWKIINFPSPIWDTVLMYMGGWQTEERCGRLNRSLVHLLLRCRGLGLMDYILRLFFDGVLFIKGRLRQNIASMISKPLHKLV